MTRIILLIIFISIIQFSNATTLTIKSATKVKDAYTANGGESANNYGKLTWTGCGVGTVSSNPETSRSFIRFDLSQIPQNATINSAVITLYADTPIGGGNTTIGGSNASYFRRITQDWNDNIITWNSQPSVTNQNQVSVPSSITNSQNITADIKDLVQYFVNNAGSNYGVSLALQDESIALLYRTIHCYSVEGTDSTLWPQLIVDYTAPAPPTVTSGTVVIKQSCYIKDNLVLNGVESLNNYGELPYIEWGVGTVSSNPETSRTFMHFDLSQVPQNAQISSAMLNFQCDQVLGGQITTSGSNASYVSRIVQDWNDNIICYNTQPMTSTQNMVSINSSISTTQNIQVDIKDIVQLFIDSPQLNYGIMLALQDESYSMPYRSMHHYSVESTDSSQRPQLVIKYSANTGINNLESDIAVSVYPNPTSGYCTISIASTTVASISASLIDISGKEIKTLMNEQKTTGKLNYTFPTTDIASGLYFIKLYNSEHQIAVRKVVVE